MIGLALNAVGKGKVKQLTPLRWLHKCVLTSGLGFVIHIDLVFAFVWRSNIKRKLQIIGRTLCISLV